MGELKPVSGWGRFPIQGHQLDEVPWVHEPLPWSKWSGAAEGILPRGLGRSYGDSCLNENGWLVSLRHANRFRSFDVATGVLDVESGASLREILEVFVPRGWFLPVVPGTQDVTIGGAIANDVHGKNHHLAGSFGCFVEELNLARSDGSVRRVSREQDSGLFFATLGGLGLTGILLSAKIRLKKVPGPSIESETLPFHSLAEFGSISTEAREWEYTVGWLDLANPAKALRGLFFKGRHSERADLLRPPRQPWSVPLMFPSGWVCGATVRGFNELYFKRGARTLGPEILHYEPFFFPLDRLKNWNRLYGKKGFMQYQFVVPADQAELSISLVVGEMALAGIGSTLSVLKAFGEKSSGGFLSFPRPGWTLTLDFPNKGERLLALLNRLDSAVLNAGGAVYPAKDCRMSRSTFEGSFSRLGEFEKYKDPKISSSFWRRVRK